MKMKPYISEIIAEIEFQQPVSEPKNLLEVRENLYKDRITTWYEYIPSGYIKGTPVPLVFQMHGGGGDGLREAYESDWHRIAEEETFIVVYPNSHSFGRWECDEADIETLCLLLERMCQRYTIDRSRIYMQGMSNGEMITTVFVLEHSELLAAAGFVAGPLPADMIPHAPKIPLPCIQIRGEKDVHFPHQSFEQDDVYKPKSLMNDYNRCLWMKANSTSRIPIMEIRGKDNFFSYSGETADLIYWEVKDMGHRCPSCVPRYFWDYCYSGWARENGALVRKEPNRKISDSNGQFAIAVGGHGIYKTNKLIEFEMGSAPECLIVNPMRHETDPYYDIGEMLLSPSIYVPLEAFSLGLSGKTTILDNGSFAILELTDGRKFKFEKNNSTVFTDDEMFSLKKPCLYRFGIFFVPVLEVAEELLQCFTSEIDNVVLISDKPCQLTKGGARLIAHLLGAPAIYPEPEIEI